MRQIESYTCSLSRLENWFATEVEAWLRQKIDSGGLSQEAISRFAKARRRCAEHLKRKEGSSLVLTVNDFLDQSKVFSRRKAMSNLNGFLGSLVERFGASSGSLLLLDDDKEWLEELIPHNVSVDWKRLRYKYDRKACKGCCGITVWVGLEKRGVIENDVNKGPMSKYYQLAHGTTKSEMAVPIFGIDGETVIGVLNIESDQLNAFLKYQLGELQASAWQLLPDLLILKHSEQAESTFGWHPDINGYDTSSLIKELCDKVSNSQSDDYMDGHLVCSTVWLRDTPKAVFNACAAVRFNYEYIDTKALPANYEDENGRIIGTPVPIPSWLHGETSFTGSVADLPRGEAKHKRIAEVNIYHNRDKAARMGVEAVFATPIYSSIGKSVNVNTAIGVLSLYYFRRHQSVHRINYAQSMQDADTKWLAEVIGSLIEESQRLKEKVAIATLLARLHEHGIPLLNFSAILRREVHKFLNNSGCTVLVGQITNSIQDSQFAVITRILETTGLEHPDGRPLHDRVKNTACFVEEELTKYANPSVLTNPNCMDGQQVEYYVIRGITAFLVYSSIESNLANNVRKADVQDPWETGSFAVLLEQDSAKMPRNTQTSPYPSGLLLLPSNDVHEGIVATNAEHRRLLAASTPLGNATSGVIRVVRGANSVPFTNADSMTLALLAKTFKPYFLLEDRHFKSSDSLGIADSGICLWNRRYIEALMQYLLRDLDLPFADSTLPGKLEFGSVLLRTRTADAYGNEVMRNHFYFSKLSRQPMTEAKGDTVYQNDNRLEWHSLEKNQVVWITWNDDPSIGKPQCVTDNKQGRENFQRVAINKRDYKYRVIGQSNRARRCALLVPFSIESLKNYGDMLLTIEGHFEKDFDKKFQDVMSYILQTVCKFCRLVSCMGRDNAKRKSESQNYNKDDTWSEAAEMIQQLEINLPKPLQNNKLMAKPTEVNAKPSREIYLWYGCILLSRQYITFENKTDEDQTDLEDAIIEKVLQEWRELVLGKVFSHKIVTGLSNLNCKAPRKGKPFFLTLC